MGEIFSSCKFVQTEIIIYVKDKDTKEDICQLFFSEHPTQKLFGNGYHYKEKNGKFEELVEDTRLYDGMILYYKKPSQKDFGFSKMEKKTLVQPVKVKGINHRTIKPGLILMAECQNKECEAFSKKCCINKGFGEFNIGKEKHECICPICSQNTKPALGVCLYKCKYKLNGRYSDGEKRLEEGECEKILKYAYSDTYITKWNNLSIDTSPYNIDKINPEIENYYKDKK